MYKELSIMSVFFEDSIQEFHIREVARLTGMNHMTVRRYLNQFVKEGILVKQQRKPFFAYAANQQSKKWTNLKLFYNREKLRESHLIEDLERFYDYPTIVLFGSYAHATDTKDSDIDICIITNIKKELKTEKYKSLLQRPISPHMFTEKEFRTMKKTNPELINSICNGTVLSGQLGVLP